MPPIYIFFLGWVGENRRSQKLEKEEPERNNTYFRLFVLIFIAGMCSVHCQVFLKEVCILMVGYLHLFCLFNLQVVFQLAKLPFAIHPEDSQISNSPVAVWKIDPEKGSCLF